MFKLVDRETGRLLALRADITPQIARIVATRLREEPKPIRLAYVTNVFRYDEPQVSHYREFYQAGVALIGLEKPEAEVEIIAMAIEGLRALGLDHYQLVLAGLEVRLPCFVWKGFPTFRSHLRMRPVSRRHSRRGLVGGSTFRRTPISRSPLDKN